MNDMYTQKNDLKIEVAPRPSFLQTLSVLLSGKSITRAYLNFESRNYTLSGVVADIGGGKHPNYHSMRCVEPLEYRTLDLKEPEGSSGHINLEQDKLPFQDSSLDAIVALNILEHIYNHRHVLQEIHRTLKSGGELIGFVPFLMFYHPDPQDYFRYTESSLVRLLTEAGFTKGSIRIVGGGIFAAQFQLLVQSLPAPLRGIFWFVYGPLDALYLWFRPQTPRRYPLGYFFSAKK